MLLVAAWAQLAIAAVVTAQAAQQPINASRFLDRVEVGPRTQLQCALTYCQGFVVPRPA